MNTNKTEPSVVEFYTINRMTVDHKAYYRPNDRRFATDWTVGVYEKRYRVMSRAHGTLGVETMIFAVNFDEHGEEEPTYDPVQTLCIYREDLFEHKKVLEDWVRDICEGTPSGEKHVFDI